MTRNQKKISTLILFIVAIVFAIFYQFVGFEKSFKFSFGTSSVNTNYSNDVWQGEPFSYFRDLKTATAKKYMISTANELSSQVGKEILEKGGNAIDAAIAAQMVLNVVEPQSSGIGGGAFILYYDAKTKTSHYFNGRETAPQDADEEMFLDKDGKPRPFNDVVRGGLSVGTPGLLKALKAIHEKHGKLEWKELFTPAITIARNGFPMDERIKVIAQHVAHLKDFDGFAKLYLKEDKTPKDLGSIITNPELAATFETIANEGIQSFYEGKIAKDIVDAVQNSPVNPGELSLDDLKNYQVKQGDLVCGTYRVKYKICSMPLPSSGGVTLLQALGILENFNLERIKPSSVEAIHLISEATRLAYADRNKYLADVKGVPIDKLLDKKYLSQRADLIDKNKAMIEVVAGDLGEKISYQIDNSAPELPSTTHLSVVDGQGNAVSMTSSIEYYFGSVLSVDGFMLNNQMTDFSFVPTIDGKPVANRVEPGKQPRSSMSPTFVFDSRTGKLLMVVGSPGGPRIIQFVLKTIIAYIDWDLDIQKSISLPNFVVLNDTIELENRTPITKLQQKLEEMGHKVKVKDIVSGINAIVIERRAIRGGSDPRRGGLAVGE